MSLELGGGGVTSAAAACVAEPEEVSGTSSPQTGTNKGKLVTATAKPCYYALIYIGSDAATQKTGGRFLRSKGLHMHLRFMLKIFKVNVHETNIENKNDDTK